MQSKIIYILGNSYTYSHTYLSRTKSVLRTDIRVMAGDTGNQGAAETAGLKMTYPF